MDVEFARLPSGTSGWLTLIDYALELGDLAEVDWLELKGTLPFADRGDRKQSAVVLARAVLAMANRLPDAAERSLGGHGVVLVGVAGNAVVGAEQVDGAVLRDALEPYVGDDGPGWDHLYVSHSQGLVLVLVVDPPQWGDAIHVCRREYAGDRGGAKVRDGDVFVRVPSMTRLATSSDLAKLQERLGRSAVRGAQVSVHYDDGFNRVDTKSVLDIIAERVDDVCRNLLKDLPPPPADSLAAAFRIPTINSMTADRRSPAAFRREVQQWQFDAKAKAQDAAADFFRHELARGTLTVENTSDRYLEDVRVQAYFPPGVQVLAKSDAAWSNHDDGFDFLALLPTAPNRWGIDSYLSHLVGVAAIDYRAVASATRSHPFDVDETADGAVVTWSVGDLRPRSTEVGHRDKFVILSDSEASDISVSWKVTAKRIDHVLKGSFALQCLQPHGNRLSWAPSNDA